jgi:uncharacterized protein DUF4129
VSARRLLPVGAGVTALLVLVGIASHGRPLAGGRGRGPTATFFDYVATTLAIVAVSMAVFVVYIVLSQRRSTGGPLRRGRWHLVSTLIMLGASALISWLVLSSGFIQRYKQAAQHLQANQAAGPPQRPPAAAPKNVRNARLRWDEVAVVVALLGGAALVVLAGRRTRKTPHAWQLGRGEAVSLALDESLDDLRTDPDLRRAIIAAYARMEAALARAGLPRRPAEAPFEYMERALSSLHASATSVRRLTGLYEWAKFSHHEPEPAMRDEAVAALVSVRDELRAPREDQMPEEAVSA